MVVGIRAASAASRALVVDLDVGEFKALPEGPARSVPSGNGGEQRLRFVVAAERQQQFDAIEADGHVARIELVGLDQASALRLAFRGKPRGLFARSHRRATASVGR